MSIIKSADREQCRELPIYYNRRVGNNVPLKLWRVYRTYYSLLVVLFHLVHYNNYYNVDCMFAMLIMCFFIHILCIVAYKQIVSTPSSRSASVWSPSRSHTVVNPAQLYTIFFGVRRWSSGGGAG